MPQPTGGVTKKGYRRKRSIIDAKNAAATSTKTAAGGSASGTASRLSGFQSERKFGIGSAFRDAKARLAAAKASGDKAGAQKAHTDIKAAKKDRASYVSDKKAAKSAQRGSGKKNKKSSS